MVCYFTRWFLLFGLILGLTSAARAVEFSSAHFRFTYDERQLTREAANRAAEDAERAFAFNQEWFPGSGPSVIRCDLTPRFFGATGYAQPEQRPPRVAVRIPDLEYLGMDQAYVLRHEVAHVFSGRLASGPMGEGLADLVAGSFGDQPLAPWWGAALRQSGLWVDPDELFLTGDYPASVELDARQRVASYLEPALLLRYLKDRYGFDRVLEFLPDYSRARRTIASNETAKQRRGFRRPDRKAVEQSFVKHFGQRWDTLRSDWEAEIAAARVPKDDGRRLVIGQQTYAAIRNFEMWVLAQRGAPQDRMREIRRAFTQVNQSLRARRFDEATAQLRVAQGLVNDLKRPMLITRASFASMTASNLGDRVALVPSGQLFANLVLPR